MAEKVYVSFHYQRDHSRVQQILNMGKIEGQQILSGQSWESVKRQGDQAIRNWIDKEMRGKSTLLVLVGAETANRPWVDFEIRKAWDAGKKVFGVRVHRLRDLQQQTDTAGANPFSNVKLKNGLLLSSYVSLHEPSGLTSKDVYADIQNNVVSWIAGAAKMS